MIYVIIGVAAVLFTAWVFHTGWHFGSHKARRIAQGYMWENQLLRGIILSYSIERGKVPQEEFLTAMREGSGISYDVQFKEGTEAGADGG